MKYAVAYYPNGNESKYVGSISDYQDGGVADPVMMSQAEAEELMADLTEYVKNEYIGKNDADNEQAHYAFEQGKWGFDIEEFDFDDEAAAGQMKYVIRDREAGNEIERFATREEAEKQLAVYEEQDRADGIFVEDFYEIKALPLTYDVVFNDDESTNAKGMQATKVDAILYVKLYNGTNESYFADYKGGVVQVVCNETGDVVYEETVK